MKWLLVLVGILLTTAGAFALPEMNVIVFPDIPDTTFTYHFVFSSDDSCTPLLNVSRSITTNAAGRGNATLDTSGLTTVPTHLCTYRTGSLVGIQSLNRNAFEQGNLSSQGNGTVGYLPYYASPIVLNNTGLFYDVADGEFGIGTAAPAATLHVLGTGVFTQLNATTIFQNGNAVLDATHMLALYTNISLLQTYQGSSYTNITDLQIRVNTINGTYALQSSLASLVTNFTNNQTQDNTSISNLQIRVNTINSSYAQQSSLASLVTNFTNNQTQDNTSISNLQIRVNTLNGSKYESGSNASLYSLNVTNGNVNVSNGNLIVNGNVSVNGTLLNANNYPIADGGADFWNPYTLEFTNCNANAVNPFLGATTGSATFTAQTGNPEHPGICRLTDSTTANANYRVLSDATAFRVNGTERARFIFRQVSTRTTASCRFGFQDSTAIQTLPTDGIYFNFTASVLTGSARSNSATTTTTTSYSTALNAWYNAIFTVNSAGTSVLFELYDENVTTLLWSDTVASNIPIAAGRETGFGVICGETSTDAAQGMADLDFMNLQILQRIRYT